jgi:activator of 2-hydroxyglutaryl-CoA dehydratase
MALNIGTSFQYGTGIGSQQTSMLAAQDAGMGAAAGASNFFGATAGPLMAIGAIGSAFGSYYQAKAQRAQLRLQADLSRINARVAESAAQSTLLAGQRQEQGVRMRTAQLKSRQRATMAARGIDLGSDTAVNILTGTDVMGEIDANTVAANAVRAAWGYRTEGTNSQIAASMSEANARGVSPGASAATSLLGNAGSVASTYYSLNKVGASGR